MAAFPQPGDSFGRYEILRRIGRGGMGSVFEARQSDLERPVALKVLTPELADDPGFRARFVREARMLAGMDSPHVIHVFDSGELDGQLFIATQLVPGRDLGRVLREDGPLEMRSALLVVEQVASALADAHEAGLLHRDVKPSNILVREPARVDPFVYLCDFGIARRTDSTYTRTVGVIGTPAYMAPECHQGADASVATEIYSLGCVLWATLTGHAPYERNSDFDVSYAHIHENVPALKGDAPARSAVNDVLAKAMAKDPAQRFASAGELAADLRAARRAIGPTVTRTVEDVGAATRPFTPRDDEEPRPPTSPMTNVRTSAVTRSVAPSEKASAWGRHRPVIIASALMAILIAAGVAVALTGRDGSPGAGAAGTVKDRADESSREGDVGDSGGAGGGSEPSSASSGDQKGSATSSDDSSASKGGSSEEVAPPAAASVTCWDDSAATHRGACPTPAGRKGLESVFASLRRDCVAGSGVRVEGKVEVYECEYGDYMIRYSRWVKGYDRYNYLNRENPGFVSAKWTVQGEAAGRTWTSYESSPQESKPYQWSAAYRYEPFSVSVEAIDTAARSRGIKRVQAVAPSKVGLG